MRNFGCGKLSVILDHNNVSHITASYIADFILTADNCLASVTSVYDIFWDILLSAVNSHLTDSPL